MSTVLDYAQCPQCSYEQADTEFDCGTSEERTNCRKCGFSEYVELEQNSEGKAAFKHRVVEGAGVLFYRWKGATGYRGNFLATQEEVTKAERWLREKLAGGQVRPSSAYVSRWDSEARAVDFLIGRLFDPLGYDPDDEIAEQMGSDDLRPFQLVEKRCQVKLRYSCEHILDGWLLLVKGQPQPPADAVFHTSLPCLSCLPQCIKSLGVSAADEMAASLGRRRTRLWENRWLDGRGKYVSPAFDHPDTVEDSASLFYTAFPGRERKHPQSIGFELQLEGWSDEDISAKKWLCDCAGCRAKPMTLGCMRS